MNCRHIPKNTAYEDIMELLIQHGTSEMSQIYEQLFNEAMLIERERHIKARSHQRTPNRRGYSNGFKNKSMKSSVAETIRNIFNADSKARAVELLMSAVSSYAQSAPKLSEWMESNITEGLTVFDFPSNHRRRIRTTNSLERINREIKRRTRVATLFPSEASCERLISAVLIEISEEWETGKTYMSLKV